MDHHDDAPNIPESAKQQLRDQFAWLREATVRTRLSICLASSAFVAADGPRWLGYSINDYIGARLGVRKSTFYTWLRCGRVMEACPEFQRDVRNGQIKIATVDEVARVASSIDEVKSLLPMFRDQNTRDTRSRLRQLTRGDSEHPTNGNSEHPTNGNSEHPTNGNSEHPTNGSSEHPTSGGAASEDPGDGPNIHQVSYRLPGPLANYVQDTVELARGLAGEECPEDQALAYIALEAASEITLRLTPDQARAKYRYDSKINRPADPPPRPRGNWLDAFGRNRASQSVRPGQSTKLQRRLAHALDRYLVRRTRRLECLDVWFEAQLLELYQRGVHEQSGYRRIDDFARDVLDLPSSTTFDLLRRARQQRRDHPVARARERGQLSAIQAELLERFQRQAHVPLSDLDAWIEKARTHTTRWLRDAIQWAKREAAQDYRAWSLAGCPPPTTDQLRTPNRSLEQMIQNPEPLDIHTWSQAPLTTVNLTMESDTLDLVMQMVGSIQQKAQFEDNVIVPVWFALFRVFHTARRAWATNYDVRTVPSHLRRIHDRDGWRCRTPECTRRANLQGHHIRYQGDGGPDDDWNRVSMCAFHHLLGEHGHIIRVTGRADASGDGLRWEMGLDEKGNPIEVFQGDRRVDVDPNRGSQSRPQASYPFTPPKSLLPSEPRRSLRP